MRRAKARIGLETVALRARVCPTGLRATRFLAGLTARFAGRDGFTATTERRDFGRAVRTGFLFAMCVPPSRNRCAYIIFTHGPRRGVRACTCDRQPDVQAV